MESLYFCLIIALLSSMVATDSDPKPLDENSLTQQYFERLKQSGYNKDIMPMGNRGHGSPVEVYCTMYLIDIHQIDDFSMNYKATFYFRQSWNDTRLEYLDQDISFIVFNDAERIWTPDLFFVQGIEGIHHSLISPNTFLRIQSNGEVRYSVRLTVIFSCPMDLSKYPHDVQKCSFTVESYGRTSDKLELSWDRRLHYPPISAANITTLPFMITGFQESVEHETVSTGEYTALRITLTFQRKIGFLMTRMYLPSIIFVLLSWFSFCMPSKMVHIRLPYLLVILYIIIHIGYEINDNIPPTSYTKGSDVWMAVCESLVFAAFLEFITVYLIARNNEKLKNKICKNDPEAQRVLDSEAKMNAVPINTSNSVVSMVASRLLNGDNISKRIDKMCVVLFPVLFVIFNFIYWLVYCTGY